MNYISVNELSGRLIYTGRTYIDNDKQAVFFNWTNGGFELEFTGTLLIGDFSVLCDNRLEQIPNGPGQFETLNTPDYPWISVLLDGSEVPYKKLPFNMAEEQIVLFHSETPETHRIRVVKLTENFRTAVGLKGFLAEGEFGAAPEEHYAGAIEFIGDSITCGFGIDTLEGTRQFYTAEEDGRLTHGYITAKNLNLKPYYVSISGISLTDYGFAMLPLNMEKIYPYADMPYELKKEKTEFLPWDFAGHPVNYIVINLGTNDASSTLFGTEPEDAERIYEEHYREFLKTVRRLNGPEPKIICALGSIEHQFYNNLLNAVKAYTEETGDTRIHTLKYRKMLTMGRDTGACFHPSRYKQAQMAEELTALIRKISGIV